MSARPRAASLKLQVLLALGSVAAIWALLGLMPAAAGAGTVRGHYIVTLKHGSPISNAKSQAAKLGVGIDYVYRHALRGYAGTIPADRLDAVRSDPRVKSVTPDRTFHAAAGPCPICQIPQITTRGARRVDADLSSARSGDGEGAVPVNVAILDTGIDPTQPDLNVRGGVDCQSGTGFQDRGYGHGTIVAGVVGARDNKIGIVGVAPGARLWAARVLNGNLDGTLASVICGVDWVTGTRGDGDPSNNIEVANMSLTGPGHDAPCGRVKADLLHKAICRSSGAGVTYVAGAGNDGRDFRHNTPATYSGVLTATAIADSDGEPGGTGGPNPCIASYGDDVDAAFSNFAVLPSDQKHTVAAPGTCISSTWLNHDVATDSGTSYASPFVAGTVALCIAYGRCRNESPAEIVPQIVQRAAAYNAAHPGYGFQGDPLRPQSGRYYGYLIRAGSY